MSQFTYRGKESYWRIIVGWDNPLETFFAQVWDEREDQDECPLVTFWVGGQTAEVSTIEELESLLAPFGEIPKECKVLLEESESQRTCPTDLQKLLRNLIA